VRDRNRGTRGGRQVSIESLAIALHHSRATGTAKLVLIGIANHDGDGGAWPAVSTLAHYAGVDKRNVQRALDRLEQLGEIRRIRGAGGDHSTADHRRPNLYRFLLTCPHDCDRSSQHRTRRTAALMAEPIDIFGATEVAVAPRVADSSPHDASATQRGGGSATQTTRLTPPQVNEVGSSDYRARARKCEKGHPLIAGERFCELGHYVTEQATA
jgi:hypothetical protein